MTTNRLLHRRTITAALLAGALALGGCGSDAEDPAAGGSAAAGESTAAGRRVIEHAMGETTLDGVPERVVALDRSMVDPAIALGLTVVGRTELAGDEGLPDYFGADGAEYAGAAASVGPLAEPSLERIAELDPDVILSAKVRHEELYPQLAKIAPTIFTETTGATWKDNLRLVGEVAGEQERAEERIAEFEERAARIGDRVREKLGANPTVSVVRFVNAPTRLYKDDTYIGVILADLGFDRTEASAGEGFAAEVSEEEIGMVDADYIVVTTYDDGEGESAAMRERFQANPLWAKLTGTIYEADDEIWMSAVGIYGANEVLDDVAEAFGVDPE